MQHNRLYRSILILACMIAAIFSGSCLYASSEVTSYNFSKSNTPKTQNTTDTANHNNIKMVNPVPVNKEVSEKFAPLQKEIVYQSKDIEKLFSTRGALYDDPGVIAYINSVARRLMSGADIKIESDIVFRLVRDPTVNAFAFVDGSIYIHTGALARIENEAQLAFLLAHEISHALNKDIVYHRNDYHNKTVAFKVLDVMLAPSSVFFGILGDAAQIGSNLLYITSVMGYSRDIEARADKDAMMWVMRQGYDPNEAAGLMRIFAKEHDKYSRGIEIFFLMNHPSNTFRTAALKKMIDSTDGSQSRQGDVRSEEFLRNMVKIKLYNASLNIKLDRLEHARDNIEWVLQKYPDDPDAHYLDGEIYRLGADNVRLYRYELSSSGWQRLNNRFEKEGLHDIWMSKAKESYQEGIKRNPLHANSYKGLGLLYASQDNREAGDYFRKYLSLYPDAPDKRYVNSMLKNIQSQKGGDVR